VSGNLFGVTQGNFNGNYGAVFEISPDGMNSTETVLHHFCSRENCADGSSPAGGLTIDEKGNLWGTAIRGGEVGDGVLFKVHGTGEAVFHSFCGFLRGRRRAERGNAD
jgi:uncharacterized repeat protein (TIGR03803 family)